MQLVLSASDQIVCISHITIFEKFEREISSILAGLFDDMVREGIRYLLLIDSFCLASTLLHVD